MVPYLKRLKTNCFFVNIWNKKMLQHYLLPQDINGFVHNLCLLTRGTYKFSTDLRFISRTKG